MKAVLYFGLPLIVALSCSSGEPVTDAYGNFTATELIISAESSGKILAKNFNEGDRIEENVLVYVIDTVQSYLKQNEMIARIQGIEARRVNVLAQTEVLEEQKKALEGDVSRFNKMLQDGAASQKQIDDLKNNLSVMEKQIEQVKTNFIAIDAELMVLETSLLQVKDLLARAKVKSPLQGTILEMYAEQGETVAPGKPLFKLADLSSMELKAYFSGNQLATLKIGDTVEVFTDNGSEELINHEGTIVWIASNAEFTPKIIQTREERVNLVYAVKIRVPNNGSIKINMPGEVRIIN